ncbi:hypothetical protein POTOM_038957 [Populus tomentosa]|uniref:Uncharacterized protein n=1 Tax=Populus tomentosa TaxID=118781 RepID=A0A8X7Z1Y9_POPTO|nr:hypothetical protein POTOM_038957 [Populus tomentosa]
MKSLDWMRAFGAEADDKIELLLSQVKDEDITDLIAAGRGKLASVPCGGGAAVAAAAPADGAAAPAAAETKEEKVEEKEDADDDLGFKYSMKYNKAPLYTFLGQQMHCSLNAMLSNHYEHAALVHRVLYDSDYFEQSNLARNLYKFLKGVSCALFLKGLSGAATIPGTILHGFGTEEFRENESKVRNPSRVSSLSS